MTPRPADKQRRPAIVWLQGGFDNSIGSDLWEAAATPDNDQSARAFRNSDTVLMVPSLRGGNDNPGQRETLYGEVDDVLAAAAWLSTLEYVDPTRIYLGGHSTGGTLALLVAESTDRFRAVFAFGPVADVRGYGKAVSYDLSNAEESRLRSPTNFLAAIRTRTFIFEGRDKPGNADATEQLERHASVAKAPVQVFLVPHVDHLSILAAITPVIARTIAATESVSFTDAELAKAVSPR